MAGATLDFIGRAGPAPDASMKKVPSRCRSGDVPFDVMVCGASPHGGATGPGEERRGSTAESHELQRLE